jgi:hypothetical protein
MGTRKLHPIPARLERACRRFDRWRERKGRNTRIPIPDPLWRLAIGLAHRYGTHRTALALRLNPTTLRSRVADALPKPPQAPGRPAAAPPAFLELVPAIVPPNSADCLIEWEQPGGAKMRIHLKGSVPPDLAGLTRSFLGGLP